MEHTSAKTGLVSPCTGSVSESGLVRGANSELRSARSVGGPEPIARARRAPRTGTRGRIGTGRRNGPPEKRCLRLAHARPARRSLAPAVLTPRSADTPLRGGHAFAGYRAPDRRFATPPRSCRSGAHGRDSWAHSVSLRRHTGQGWEPFYQCLSLAAALQRRRRGTHFLSYLDPLSLATSSTAATTTGRRPSSRSVRRGDLDATIAQVRRLNAAAVVVAGEGMTPDYLAELSDTGTLVVAFDSTAEHAPSRPTCVVNPLLAPGRKAYRVEPGCQLLARPPVRPVPRASSAGSGRSAPPSRRCPFRALVAMGDDDLDRRRLERTQQLLEMREGRQGLGRGADAPPELRRPQGSGRRDRAARSRS